MKLKDVLDIIDDETWVALDLPAGDGGGRILMWNADWIGADEETAAKVAPLLERETYDIYTDIFHEPERLAPASRIVIPVAPEEPA